ncbi:MAG: holo-ACP synthase [Gammaproteobacteria bacterium]|nr:holo-ACP synthase [Gammaproteobacteria bacterium]NND61462.1 holo-ACP synthase [Gammaproteobacteria bacterium]
MIYGIGTDILRVDRVEQAYERFGDRFARRILMPQEYEDYSSYKRPVRFLAMRFAAKEALVKAMGTGFRHGMWVRDVGVRHDHRGKPEPIFSARGQARCHELGIGRSYVSLTDEGGMVVAFAVMERA